MENSTASLSKPRKSIKKSIQYQGDFPIYHLTKEEYLKSKHIPDEQPDMKFTGQPIEGLYFMPLPTLNPSDSLKVDIAASPIEKKKIFVHFTENQEIPKIFINDVSNEKQSIINEKESIIAEKDHLIEEKEHLIIEQMHIIEENEEIIKEKDFFINKRDKIIEEIRMKNENLLIEKEECYKYVKEKEEIIENLQKMLKN